MRLLKMKKTVFSLVAFLGMSLWIMTSVAQAVTATIDSPSDGATITADFTAVSGIVAASGGGQGVDLMLVIDNSNSLTISDPTRARFAAIDGLMNSFGPSANVTLGIVFFDSSATLDVPLTSVASVNSSVQTAITNHQTPGGATAIGSAIDLAVQEFQDNGRATASHIILVFTDGENTAGGDPVVAAAAAQSAGITVNVVDLASGSTGSASIAQQGGGVLLQASDATQLAGLFSSSQIVGISIVTVTNTTTGVSATGVSVVAGAYNASVDLQSGDNVIQVVATDSNGLSATSTITVTRGTVPTPTPVSRVVKLRPQVLMSGIDPMKLDLGDTSFKVLAVVREGQLPIQTVTLSENTAASQLGTQMNYEGDLPNGDKVYQLTMTFARGSLANGTLDSLWGSGAGEYHITAIDTAQQSHSFPDLEFGNNQSLPSATVTPSATQYSSVVGAKLAPQAIMVGFDPILIDYTDASFDVVAIVRPGTMPIQSVTLDQNGTGFSQAMSIDSTMSPIGNGDSVYRLTLTFPRGSFPAGAMSDLFSANQQGTFVVEVTDTAQQTHQFPQFEIGNFPSL